MLTSQLPLWATGVQSYWETLDNHVKYASESVPLRVKEAGALPHHVHNSCGLQATLGLINPSANRLCLPYNHKTCPRAGSHRCSQWKAAAPRWYGQGTRSICYSNALELRLCSSVIASVKAGWWLPAKFRGQNWDLGLSVNNKCPVHCSVARVAQPDHAFQAYGNQNRCHMFCCDHVEISLPASPCSGLDSWILADNWALS